MAEALLIGLLVGVERETDQSERHAGLRDFITVALAGGLCGLLGVAWITAATLLALTALIVVFRVQTAGRTGITTELAAVATFLLGVLTTTAGLSWGAPLAIALAVIFTLLLEARVLLRKFFLEVVNEREYQDTLRFLAVIFVILPVLPDVNYGPYGFFNPHKIWIFVILVCSISWLGYFLQKFLGEGQGLRITGLLGGLASTTAATSALAKDCAVDRGHTAAYFAVRTAGKLRAGTAHIRSVDDRLSRLGPILPACSHRDDSGRTRVRIPARQATQRGPGGVQHSRKQPISADAGLEVWPAVRGHSIRVALRRRGARRERCLHHQRRRRFSGRGLGGILALGDAQRGADPAVAGRDWCAALDCRQFRTEGRHRVGHSRRNLRPPSDTWVCPDDRGGGWRGVSPLLKIRGKFRRRSGIYCSEKSKGRWPARFERGHMPSANAPQTTALQLEGGTIVRRATRFAVRLHSGVENIDDVANRQVRSYFSLRWICYT